MIDETSIYDYGLIVPKGTSVDKLSKDAQAFIESVNAEFPSDKVFGTQEVDGEQVVYARIAKKLTFEEMESLFASFKLKWRVVGIRSAYPYLMAYKGQDEFGNEIYEKAYDEVKPVDKAEVIKFIPEATMETPVAVPVYAGTDPIVL
jgi:hypothetical protein